MVLDPVARDLDPTADPHAFVRLHMVETLSGHLSNMLNARQLDLAVLFDTHPARRWSVTPLLQEKLFVIQSTHHPLMPLTGARLRLAALKRLRIRVAFTPTDASWLNLIEA